ncbi:MAG: S23 ribosomal protein [Candidatus Amesbacteria bacterium GW2011_GWA2_42_12]|uniref:S23 ribosomal protein n=1 Tax=Candidatus Amesbacteria bacterium GW2011_GWA2_42_12 TaxID=1618356 RepID=A0A0G1B4F4_9BACT|nr:MAG: S23 ribosomal protein [Candidatus Amesbacteria bacterium GW2011_GWA2_42_12]
MYAKSYQELIVWQKSVQLAKGVYLLTKKFPSNEAYGLTSQIRRAVVSIPANIAEGYGRKTQKDYQQFLSIAYGSALELETHLIISVEVGLCSLIETTDLRSLLTEILKMLNAMTRSLS